MRRCGPMVHAPATNPSRLGRWSSTKSFKALPHPARRYRALGQPISAAKSGQCAKQAGGATAAAAALARYDLLNIGDRIVGIGIHQRQSEIVAGKLGRG